MRSIVYVKIKFDVFPSSILMQNNSNVRIISCCLAKYLNVHKILKLTGKNLFQTTFKLVYSFIYLISIHYALDFS